MILSVITILIIIFFFIYRDTVLKDIKEITEKYDNSEREEYIVDEDFLSGLRLASIGKYKESIGFFEKTKYKELSNSDKEIYLYALLQAGEFQDLIDLDKSYDEEIINKLLDDEALELLTELETDSLLIKFELAVLDNDYEKIIDLRNAEGMILDERRANIVGNAYFELGDKEEAINFTSLMADDGINMWNKESKAEDELVTKEKEIESSSLGMIMTILVIVVLLTIIIFILYKKTNIFIWLKDIKKKGKEKERVKVEDMDNDTAQDDEDEHSKKDEIKDKYSYEYNEDEILK